MVSSLLPSLRASLQSLLSSIPQSEKTRTPVESEDQLQPKLKEIWDQCYLEQFDSSASSSNEDKRIELIRGWMEVIGREVVVSPIVDEDLVEPIDETEDKMQFITSVQNRLDMILTLYEVVFTSLGEAASLEPGALFIPLLEELVELISVEMWRDLWGWVELHSKRFTKDMPASRGKALPLLRTINAFLRFLPRTPEDLVFRGRIHQFASGVISVADKSAINMRGDYNVLETTWEEDVVPKKDEGTDGAGTHGGQKGKEEKVDEEDVKMEDKQKESGEPDFYSTLWSIQQFFSNPPSLDGPTSSTNPLSTPFETFKSKTDFILPKLFEETTKEKLTSGTESLSKKRKLNPSTSSTPSSSSSSLLNGKFFHPRYLTGKKLLPHELADSSFRRQILVQYFILFQFLLNLTPASASKQAFTGGMPKTFVVGPDDQSWVKQKVGMIRDELKRMGRDGKSFEDTVLSVITRERYYAQWKNEGCPESVFEVAPLSDDSAKQAAEGWKKHLAPPPRWPFKVGSRPLSQLWRNGFENIDQLKGWKRSANLVGLEEEVKAIEASEEDDRAMGKEPSSEEVAANKELIIKNTWRGLRLASQTQMSSFAKLNKKRDLHILLEPPKSDDKPPSTVNTPSKKIKIAESSDNGDDTPKTPTLEKDEVKLEMKEIPSVTDVEMTTI